MEKLKKVSNLLKEIENTIAEMSQEEREIILNAMYSQGYDVFSLVQTYKRIDEKCQ